MYSLHAISESIICAYNSYDRLSLGAGLYPDDHWTKSTLLTTSNFEAKVAEEIAADRTFFVRWVASEG
jgi:hypothetical protein